MSHRVAAVTAAYISLVLSAAPARAQQALELPLPSPHARVDQTVGLTHFQLEYSSPGVKKRPIWGALVPYGTVWRTGANEATKLTVSRDFQFGGKAVKAGIYAIYSIPGKASWTVILNGDGETWGTEYQEKNDIARVSVKPTRLPAMRERLAFIFSDTTDEATSLDLEWERLRVRVPIKVDTKTQALANIERASGQVWVSPYMSARWLMDNGQDLNRALALVDRSIAIERTWSNHWIKAQILGKQGKKAEAIAAARTAQELGKGKQGYENNKALVAKAIQDWR